LISTLYFATEAKIHGGLKRQKVARAEQNEMIYAKFSSYKGGSLSSTKR